MPKIQNILSPRGSRRRKRMDAVTKWSIYVAISLLFLLCLFLLCSSSETTVGSGSLLFLGQQNDDKNNKNKKLSPLEMFVDLSDMLPDFPGACPDLPGYPAKVWDIAEMSPCFNLLKIANDQKECIIYNFGVGQTDPFLTYMSRSDTELPNCEIYAFDPFVSPSEIRMSFSSKIHFFEVGLWNGYSDRNVGKNGQLKSLPEIQQMLNHSAQTRITFFRSDCEGCEYGWVKHAMESDASFFERVDQMFMETHTVPIKMMSSIHLNWQNGMPPADLLEAVYHMMTRNFRVLHAHTNTGGPEDRYRVSYDLHAAGVLQYPCCREFNMIHQRLAAPKTTRLSDQQCLAANPLPQSPSLPGFLPQFRSKFHGRQNTCPPGDTPRCLGDSTNCYCPSWLPPKACVMYFFGNLTDSQELELLTKLADAHPQCSIHAYDPRWVVWKDEGGILKTHINIKYRSWGLFSGEGRRVMTTTDAATNKIIYGDLYTLKELRQGYQLFRKGDPSRLKIVHLMRIDWTAAAPCVWQREVMSLIGGYKQLM